MHLLTAGGDVMHESDVIIVGSGQAAKPLAVRLARVGRRVVQFEAVALGGTCINTGCTPTKTMIASAHAAHVARTAGRLGVHARAVEVDLGQVVDRKDAVVRSWRAGIEAALAAAGERVRLVRQHARFVGDRTLEAGGERYHAPVVILDVGARAATPSLRGLDKVPWLDNASLMALRRVPEHLVIVGGGYIGCEMGQMFRRFGARVSIVHSGAHLLTKEDPDIADALEGVFTAEGIDVALRSSGVEATSDGDGVALRLADGRTIRGSHLLVALGRRANTDSLGCEAGGVRLDPRGNIVADEYYATSAPGVYAVGDALGGPQFTHTSWDDHRLLFDILTKPDAPRRPRSERLVPYSVFTDPQVAGVGLNETSARARGIKYQVATIPMADVARAIEVDETAGLMKVLVDPSGERILGAFIVGAEAGELIHVFISLMQAGASPRAMVDAEFVHPTFSEGLQTLVMKLPKYALS
jgi:pyruvate/2-oxoglutarate dehydrogenase complex dihydrolipoamide dehydrogenase (E3) component